jgi:hypothetical protein
MDDLKEVLWCVADIEVLWCVVDIEVLWCVADIEVSSVKIEVCDC